MDRIKRILVVGAGALCLSAANLAVAVEGTVIDPSGTVDTELPKVRGTSCVENERDCAAWLAIETRAWGRACVADRARRRRAGPDDRERFEHMVEEALVKWGDPAVHGLSRRDWADGALSLDIQSRLEQYLRHSTSTDAGVECSRLEGLLSKEGPRLFDTTGSDLLGPGSVRKRKGSGYSSSGDPIGIHPRGASK